MEDVLVLILLAVLVTIGLALFVGGLAALAVSGFRSMRRSVRPTDQPSAAWSEHDG